MKKATTMFVAMMLFVVSGIASAGYTSPPATVTYMHNWSQGFTFALNGINTTCTADNQIYVSWTNANASQLYAQILAAYESGDLVTAQVACTGPGGQANTNDADIRKQ